ncbi:MAG: hypothetical protein ACLT98_09265 [Eggerthellaceae bacterium]
MLSSLKERHHRQADSCSTGLSRYHQVGLTYKGQSVNGEIEEQLPDFAPSELREIESRCLSRRIGRSTTTT